MNILSKCPKMTTGERKAATVFERQLSNHLFFTPAFDGSQF